MTFSIVARDVATGAFGTAVATTVTAVGALAPHVSLDAAVSTQAYVNVDLGIEMLERVARGQTVSSALADCLAADAGAQQRQVLAIDRSEADAWTGSGVLTASGHIVGPDHVVAGNLLVGRGVLDVMSDAFQRDPQADFVDRLISALEAGQAAGGERASAEFAEAFGSAAVIVASPQPRAFHNLRVDASRTPIADLRRVYLRALASTLAIEEFYAGAITIRPTFWRRVSGTSDA